MMANIMKTPKNTKIDISEITFRIKILESEDWKAMVTINFGWISIKGYRIKVSEFLGEHGEFLWVVPPCYRTMAGFKPIVHIEKELWKKIEKLLVKEYRKKFEEYAEKKLGGVSDKEF